MTTSQAGTPMSRGVVLDLRDGLIPVSVFIGAALVTVAVTALVRLLMTTVGYDIQKVVDLALTGIGFLSAIVLYGLMVRRSWRIAGTFDDQGQMQHAQTIRWALIFGALLFMVPVVLGFALPQHPAVLP